MVVVGVGWGVDSDPIEIRWVRYIRPFKLDGIARFGESGWGNGDSGCGDGEREEREQKKKRRKREVNDHGVKKVLEVRMNG